MIRAWTKYFIVSLLSVLFLYAACGYNLAKYCCTTCEAEGIEALINEPCHNAEATTCCPTKHTENSPSECANNCGNNTCLLYHLKVDDSVLFSDEKRFTTNQVYSIILFANLLDISLSTTANVIHSTLHPPDNPHPLAGIAMLRSNCILRI
jgi:hypothetical protein